MTTDRKVNVITRNVSSSTNPMTQGEVLSLMAEGRSNAAIAGRLFIAEKTVDKFTSSIFTKLALPPSEDDNRRVLAVLTYLNG